MIISATKFEQQNSYVSHFVKACDISQATSNGAPLQRSWPYGILKLATNQNFSQCFLQSMNLLFLTTCPA
jgi:hypothetical protein